MKEEVAKLKLMADNLRRLMRVYNGVIVLSLEEAGALATALDGIVEHLSADRRQEDAQPSELHIRRSSDKKIKKINLGKMW